MIGLVFSGGGGKGAYEIGVWRALRELGIEDQVSAVSGTSIGALNTVLFLNGDLELAEKIWLELEESKVLMMTPKRFFNGALNFLDALNPLRKYFTRLMDNKTALFDRAGLMEIIDDNLDLKKVINSETLGIITCCKADTHEPVQFEVGQCSVSRLKKVLCASSAIPFLYDEENIDDEYYVDGGIKGFLSGNNEEGDSNLPIQPLIDKGSKTILAVHLNRAMILKDEIAENADVQLLNLYPSKALGKMLSFSQVEIRERMELGYSDTMAALGHLREVQTNSENLIISTFNIESMSAKLKTLPGSKPKKNLALEQLKLQIGVTK